MATGGDFANGAVTGTYSRLLNDLFYSNQVQTGEMNVVVDYYDGTGGDLYCGSNVRSMTDAEAGGILYDPLSSGCRFDQKSAFI